MGKMKAFMMDEQERLDDLLMQIIPNCDTFEEFVIVSNEVAKEYNIMLPQDMIDEAIDNLFENFWENYRV